MEDLSYEQQAHDTGYALVCGVDEAGAGPLMGPVYAAAVILPEKFELPGLNDSKKLSEKRRLALEQQREDIEAMLTEIAQFETQCQQELTRRNTR